MPYVNVGAENSSRIDLYYEDHARLEHDARAATAQARFTGLIVVLLPLGGALLAELASPGYVARLAGSFLTAWLGGMALAMQAVAAVLIRRLGRVREAGIAIRGWIA